MPTQPFELPYTQTLDQAQDPGLTAYPIMPLIYCFYTLLPLPFFS